MFPHYFHKGEDTVEIIKEVFLKGEGGRIRADGENSWGRWCNTFELGSLKGFGSYEKDKCSTVSSQE